MHSPTNPTPFPWQVVARKLQAHMKKSWLPDLEEAEDVSKVESKFGGTPALKDGEPWPQCPECGGDLTLFLQLNSRRKRLLGGSSCSPG